MQTLARVLLLAMETFITAEEPCIDWQACGEIENDLWWELAKATPVERQALAKAAAERLAELLREPDEYGYTPRGLVTQDHREFLESLADGSAWDELADHEGDGEAD